MWSGRSGTELEDCAPVAAGGAGRSFRESASVVGVGRVRSVAVTSPAADRPYLVSTTSTSGEVVLVVDRRPALEWLRNRISRPATQSFALDDQLRRPGPWTAIDVTVVGFAVGGVEHADMHPSSSARCRVASMGSPRRTLGTAGRWVAVHLWLLASCIAGSSAWPSTDVLVASGHRSTRSVARCACRSSAR